MAPEAMSRDHTTTSSRHDCRASLRGRSAGFGAAAIGSVRGWFCRATLRHAENRSLADCAGLASTGADGLAGAGWVVEGRTREVAAAAGLAAAGRVAGVESDNDTCGIDGPGRSIC